MAFYEERDFWLGLAFCLAGAAGLATGIASVAFFHDTFLALLCSVLVLVMTAILAAFCWLIWLAIWAGW
jgi:hypothetical protein